MSTRNKFVPFVGVMALCLGVCGVAPASADSAHSQRKAAAKKLPAPLPPLPSGPTGPVPQIPLDSIAPVPPQVSYQNGQLTIVAPNSTLSDILRAVRKQTGADIDIPTASDRVVTHLGPGPAQEVMAELLNGSRFNYVLLGSPEKAGVLTRVVLVAKTGGTAPVTATASNLPGQQPMDQAANVDPQEATDTAEPDPPEENQDESAEQAAAEAEQPAAPTADQPETKTPQQMLQEMQQRQLQLQQQQQQTGQPPAPGAITSPRSPQEQE
jgi:hypothetical protein